MTRRFSSRFLIALAMVLLALLIAGALVYRLTPPAGLDQATPGTNRQRLNALVTDAAAHADRLATLGETRSRDLLTLRREQSALLAALDGADALLAADPALANDPAAPGYRAAASRARAAIAAGQTAFLHLDWSALAAATGDMRQSADELQSAAAEFAP